MHCHALIDASELFRLIQQNSVLVFDCRFDLGDPDAGRRAYLAGHLPGARYVDLERDMSGAPNGRNGRHPLPDRDTFATHLAQLGLGRETLAVSYDASGGFYASRLWWMLRWAGHEPVAVLDGSLPAWTTAGLPLAQGEEPEAMPGNFTARSEPGMQAIDAPAVEANLKTGERLVIDARTAQRFHGAPHPLDTASGHIPGAANRFYQNNLAADGRFKAAAELRHDFEQLLAGRAPETIVHQCGSGVTATHNLLAMEVAGLAGSCLYPGSWSEWTSDPARPIAVD